MKTVFTHALFGAICLLLVIDVAWSDTTSSSIERDASIGRHIENFTLSDCRGKEYSLADFADQRLLVVAFLGTECPLAKLYAPRLASAAKRFSKSGVGFVGIYANSQDSISDISAHARQHGIQFPVLKDLGNQVADQMGASRTPEVFLLDEHRAVRYQGRIDDQYGVGFVRDEPQRADLEVAINELLQGDPVSVPITRAVGCIIGRVRQPDPDADVTYSRQIARILQDRCVECHREGEIAPFELTDFDEVAGWAEMIAEVVRENRMPPWHASGEYGSFVNDRHMTDAEKQLIQSWVDAGAPQGDQDDLPAPRTWTTGWQLPREPDFVASITDEPFTVPAEGEVEYKYFRIDSGFTEDKWVSAIEIQPGNRAVVHHVLMFAAEKDSWEDRFGGGARGYDGIFIPGQRVKPYPDGTARRIPAGSQLVFQVHYTPVGTVQHDQSRVGMLFVDPATVEHEVHTVSAVNMDFRIPPHAAQHRVEASSPRLPPEALLLSYTPHMHLRGKSFFYEAVLPDGQREPLLNVPRYDFNWQTAYQLRDPRRFPAGTRIHCVAEFDNSANNPHNPDPEKRVRWGEQTWDEMMIGYFDYSLPAVSDAAGAAVDRRQRRSQELFDRFDRDADGRLLRDEVPKRFRRLFDRLDENDDKQLTVEELAALIPNEN